jgi:hypothetical protein
MGRKGKARKTAGSGEEAGVGRRHQARDARQGKCPANGRTEEKDEPGRVPAKQPPLEEIIDLDVNDETFFEVLLL